MNSTFKVLFKVLFKHNYFSDKKLNCIDVTPSSETKLIFRNYGLQLNSFYGGFNIVYEEKFSNEKREKNDINVTLRFILTLKDTDFYNYTSEFTQDIVNNICYFHNISEKRSSFSMEVLHTNEYVSERDIIKNDKFDQNFFTKPFGVLDILFEENSPNEFTINFQEKSTFWRYIIVGEHFLNLNEPAVIFGKEVFVGPEKIVLPNNREALTFESLAPISLFQVQKNNHQLVENYTSTSSKYKVILKALPSPDIKNITALPRKEGKENRYYSEIFIY